MKAENRFRTDLCNIVSACYGRTMYFQKHHGSAYSSGLTDMLFTHAGETVQLELKCFGDTWKRDRPDARTPLWRFGKNPTLLQRDTLRRIHMAGGNMGILLFIVPMQALVAVHRGQAINWMTDDYALTIGEVSAWLESSDGWGENLKVLKWRHGPVGWDLRQMLFGR